MSNKTPTELIHDLVIATIADAFTVNAKQSERFDAARAALLARLAPLWTICTGCGHDSRIPILPTAIACCPDSRYRTLQEFAAEAIQSVPDVKALKAEWLLYAIARPVEGV